MKKSLLYIFIIANLFPLILLGQVVNETNFFNYKNTTGLNYTQISDIVQGSDGAMYFISREGVVRYDGIKFTNRTSPYFNEGTSVNNLKLTPSGKIMGVFASRFIFVLDNWARLKLSVEDAKDHSLFAYEFIDNTHLWVSTDKGVYYSKYYEAKDSMDVLYCLESSLPFKNIIKMEKDITTGMIWGLDRNLGYFEISEGPEFVSIPLRIENQAPVFYDLLKTDKYIFVLHDRRHMSVFSTDGFKPLLKYDFGKSLFYARIEAINSSDVWIASPYSGLVKFSMVNDNGDYEFRRYTTNNGLTNNYVYQVFQDRDGIFWFGTNDGVSKLASERFEKINIGLAPGTSGFPNNWIEIEGRLYSISDPYGVGEIIESTEGTIIKQIAKGQIDKAFYGMHLDNKSNVLWFFSDQGIFYQYPALSNSPLVEFKSKELSGFTWWQAYSLDDQQLLLGGSNEVIYASVQGNQIEMLDKIELPGGGKEVSAFYPFDTELNDILIAGEKFLIRVYIDDKINVIADLKHWFDNPDFSVYDIEKDSNGNWLFATANDGLIIRDSEALYTFKNNSEIPFNTIYDIHAAKDGSYWLGSYKGLTNIRYNGEGKLDSKHFGFWEMIPPVDINFHSIFEASDGRIFYGLPNSIGIYYPSRDTVKQNNVSINLSRISLERTPISLQDVTELPYEFSNLTLDFNLPFYFHEKQIQYFYRIDPISRDWHQTLAPGQILISNLPSGEFILKLKAVDPGGIAYPATVDIPIKVDSPLWAKWWFILIAFIATVLILAVLWQIRIRTMMNRQRELQKIVDIRTQEISLKNTELEDKNLKLAELQKTKDEFLSIVAHDLKNPINAVVNLSRMIQHDYNEIPGEVGEDAKVIESAATHMNNLVKNLLDFNRIEANQLVTHMQPLSVLNEIERILETYRLLAWPKNITINLDHVLSGDEMIFGDTDAFGQICGNLVSNAIKFSDQNSSVNFLVAKNDGKIVIQVEDHGPGIPDELKNKIFEKFFTYEGEKKQNKMGNGLGLTIVKKLIELHKGEIAVDDQEKGTGAIFIIKFDLYTEEEKSKVKA